MEKYSLGQLQMAYLEARLSKETEGERCPLCWEKQCNHNVNVKADPFLNLTAEEFQYV